REGELHSRAFFDLASSSASLHRLDDLLRGIVEIVGGGDVEVGFGDDVFAKLDVGAFEAHHQRHPQTHFLHGRDHAFGDDIAFHDAAENVDQDALHFGIGGGDLSSGRRLPPSGAR